MIRVHADLQLNQDSSLTFLQFSPAAIPDSFNLSSSPL